MLNIVLFGPPGAGKGTQAEYLKESYQLIHLSTGDLLRSQIAEKTVLGMAAQEYMNKGELVPDEVVIGMIESKFHENKDAKGFIFDGFPRTVEQAKALDVFLNAQNEPITAMLALEVEKQELTGRLLLRGKSSGRSDDLDQNVIENRIAVYHEKTAPLMDYYSDQNKFHSVNGMGSIEEITDRLNSVIKKIS